MRQKHVLFASFLSLMCVCAHDAPCQWAKTSGPPKDAAILCFAVSGMKLFAGTNHGVFLSTNSGNSWTEVNTGLPDNTCVTAFAVSGTNLFAGTYGIGIFRSTDNGAHWSPARDGLPRLGADISAFAVSGACLVAGTMKNSLRVFGGDGVFRTTDNGTRWTSVNTGLSRSSIISALATSSTSLFAGIGDGVFCSTNNGRSWNRTRSKLADVTYQEDVVSALAVIGSDLFVGTDYSSQLAHDADSMSMWNLYSFSHEVNIRDSRHDRDYVFRSTDKGASWTAVSGGLPMNKSVAGFAASGTNLFAAIADIFEETGFGVYLSSNSGAEWTDISAGLPAKTSVDALTVCGPYLFGGTGSGIWRRPLSEMIGSKR